ncbi:MAG: GAF domain-containing protein [Candidatus Promineifilaceae bacterium]
MSAPQAETREAARIQDRRASDTVMLSLLIAFSLSVLSIAGSIIFARAGNVPRAFVPAFSAVVTLAGAGLIYRGRLIAGATLSLIALGATLLFLISQFTGLGIAGALIFTLVAITLVAHSFPAPLNIYSLIIAIAVGALILILELYWPWKERATLPDGTFPIVIAALATGLLVVAYSMRRYRDFSLRRKFVYAFLFLSFVPLIMMLIAFQLRNSYQGPIEGQSRDLVITAVLLAAIVAVLALVFSDRLTAPIGRLQEAAARVSHGDLSVRVKVESDDDIGRLARTFNTITARLQDTHLGLELSVASRTHALAASTEVGRRLSTITDESTLVSEVVELLQESFGYYHVQIYMIEDKSKDLILVSGTGEAGQLLIKQGHRIHWGQGLAGLAADRNSVVLVPHIEDDLLWISNPHLPDTKSEVAVPISLGEEVVGVLDVQDDGPGGLGQQDADLLLSIANQVAIALQNARSYARLRRQAEHRAKINEINRAIQSTTDAESAMQVMIRELGRAVGASSTSIWLEVPAGDQEGEPTGSEAPPPATGSGRAERLI